LLRHGSSRAPACEFDSGPARLLRRAHVQAHRSRGRHPHRVEPGVMEERTVRPAAIVIFGASGDLTKRKLFPAVYNLAVSGLVPPTFAVVGVARRPKPVFESEMHENVAKFSRRKPVDPAVWNELKKGIAYVQGEFHEPATYEKLKTELTRLDRERGTQQNRVFYLAVAPDQVPTIVKGLRTSGLV